MKSFTKGMRVTMTMEGRTRFPKRHWFGTVTSKPQDPRYVNVRCDNRKSSSHWSADFWRPLKTGELTA